ncbi:MAG: hypothetical protein PHF00_05525 [Elusimicrobia bacterium]|nr:hypothetical protein [Elusimicrobiota bacterium]
MPPEPPGNSFKALKSAEAAGQEANKTSNAESAASKASAAVGEDRGRGQPAAYQIGSGSSTKKASGEQPSSEVGTKPPSLTAPPTGAATGKTKPNNDPNKWNAPIAGAKTAIYGALLGFIFLGPPGAILFGLVGFGVGYFMKKMNDA